MKNPVQKTVAVGFAAVVAIAAAMIVDLDGQQASTMTGDFRNAGTAEVRDAQGKVLLHGRFAPVAGDDNNEVEIQATLTATDGGKASGDAEVEYAKDKPNVQEVEFNVTGVPSRAVLTLVLDGHTVITATADDKGKAEAEINVTVAPRP
jgi:hypothetical protein